MAKNKKHIEDKFYTKKSVVKDLLKYIKFDMFDLIIEPSAGDGSFSDEIKHKNLIALDINPENDNVIKMNWFDFDPTIHNYKDCLVIGNPPFGVQGDLAIKFMIKCSEINAKAFAFILPKSFKKHTLQNRIPLNYHLVKEIDLPDSSYTLNSNDYDVPTIFQIWFRTENNRDKIILKTQSDYISFVKKEDEHDFAFRRVGVNAGCIYDYTLDKSIQSHYFIKCDIEIRHILENIQWEHNNTTGPRSIGKGEIIEKIELIYKKVK